MVQLAASALLLAALSAPATAAADPTCRGLTATIVGEPGGTVEGTDGDDVIVTNGAEDAHAGAGDDTVCVTSVPANRLVRVQAGRGADLVDTTEVTAPGSGTAATLGPGADRFRGGPRGDVVLAGSEYPQDRQTDRIDTGGGSDSVTTGEAGRLDADDVDMGTGTATLNLLSERSTGVVRAAPGIRNNVFLWPRSAGDWLIDDRTDRATLNGATMSEWTNFRVDEVHGQPRARIRYIGTPQVDYPELYGRVAGAELGAGDDDLSLFELDGMSGSFVGGPGDDRVRLWNERELLVDLQRGQLGTDLASPTARIGGFENLEAMFIGEARIVGNDENNDVRFSACRASLVGGRGDDRFVMRGRGPGCPQIPVERRGIRESGGPGDDWLRGSNVSDHLLGGSGQDRADGRNGSDVCRAERTVSCEA